MPRGPLRRRTGKVLAPRGSRRSTGSHRHRSDGLQLHGRTGGTTSPTNARTRNQTHRERPAVETLRRRDRTRLKLPRSTTTLIVYHLPQILPDEEPVHAQEPAFVARLVYLCGQPVSPDGANSCA